MAIVDTAPPFPYKVSVSLLPSTPSATQEVRRCVGCGKAALVCVHAWQHHVVGSNTGTVTGDYRCQACGRKVTLRPPVEIRVSRVFGYVFLIAIFPGIYFLLQARRWSRVWTDNPVVPGAPFPEIRWRDQPLDRRCARCGHRAVVRRIGKRRVNGIAAGLKYEFACEGCLTRFTTQTPLATFVQLLVALVIGAFAAAIFVLADRASTRYGWGCAFSLLAVLVLCIVGSRLRAAMRNPELRG